MPDAKISALPALTSPAAGDLLAIVDDPAGTPITKKITVSDLLTLAAPGGSTTQVQYNLAGAFAGDAGLTYDPATDALSVGGSVASLVLYAGSEDITDFATSSAGAVRLLNDEYITANNSADDAALRMIGINSSDEVVVGDTSAGLRLVNNGDQWLWPAADGSAGFALVTNGSGVLSFAAPAGNPFAFLQVGAGPFPTTGTIRASEDLLLTVRDGADTYSAIGYDSGDGINVGDTGGNLNLVLRGNSVDIGGSGDVLVNGSAGVTNASVTGATATFNILKGIIIGIS